MGNKPPDTTFPPQGGLRKEAQSVVFSGAQSSKWWAAGGRRPRLRRSAPLITQGPSLPAPRGQAGLQSRPTCDVVSEARGRRAGRCWVLWSRQDGRGERVYTVGV